MSGWHDPEEIRAELRARLPSEQEQRARLAAWRAEERRLHEWAAAVSRETADARSAAARLVTVLGERSIRARACLVCRCADCPGRAGAPGLVIAHVTRIDEAGGRAMIWTRNGGHRWLDSPFWGDVAECRVREYNLLADEVEAAMPAPGQPRVTFTFHHDD